jgi:hypothetical protein
MLTFSVCVAAVAAAVDFRQTDYAFRIGPGSAIYGRWSPSPRGQSNVVCIQATDLRARTMLVASPVGRTVLISLFCGHQ